MEFIFRLSAYDGSALDGEVVQLLTQRLEAHSRKAVPGLWKATDSLNAYAAEGPIREARRARYRVYGVILIVLGIFALVPGLAEPRRPVLMAAGAVGIVSGILELCLTRAKRPPVPPASCRKEAARLLEQRRSVDWSLPENCTELRFDETGLSVSAGKEKQAIPYGDMAAIFATDRLCLLVYGAEKAILLQKKDLIAGEPEKFISYLQEKIGKQR